MLRAAGAGRNWAIWIVVLPVAAWALLRTFGIDHGFPLATMMPFTPYVAIAALFVAFVALALENWAASVVGGLALLALAAAVLPRAIGDGTVSGKGHETVSILATNVFRGQADPAVVMGLVKSLHVDVLNVEENTPRFARELREAGIDRILPSHLLEIGGNSAGAGIYSRYPLRPLPAPPLRFRMPRAQLKLPDGRLLRDVAVHPYPPERHDVGEWEGALRSLPSAGSGAPWVLAGDFNATLDSSQLRDVIGRGYRDAADVAGLGLEPTFPRKDHPIPPITIDHVLADERLGIVEYAVEDMPGSDHRAVHAVLAMP
jgi:endonuclease/exonuclease/phosphatase (EEP) superfamily protein YafD